jgi:hypothetical protein
LSRYGLVDRKRANNLAYPVAQAMEFRIIAA